MQVGKLAGACQHVAALCDVGVARLSRGRDLALEQALLKRGEGAAGFLAVLEQRPGGVAKLRRQCLDAARAGGGIADLGEVAFFQKQGLRIARHAPREWIR